jgi:hypothetical protein
MDRQASPHIARNFVARAVEVQKIRARISEINPKILCLRRS